ncbi:DUF2378 family protein [Hyalangium versicolor]|uniref:DUF2378 family protein n=1 Tax=Hyalangium versicolor TaxID=2861190 RepID=UPI001CCC8F5D|nr:DUF2378 family protein [Hyalangium versicolor]
MSQSKPPVKSSGAAERPSAYARFLSLPTPSDTVRGLFINGVLGVVKSHGGEAALREVYQLLADKRFERSFISFSSYPTADFVKVLVAASQVLAPQFGSPDATARHLGASTVRDFLDSMAGRTLMLLSGNSAQKMLSNIPSAYRAASSFGERTVAATGEKSAVVTFRHDFMPLAHTEGVLLAVLQASDVKNPQVRSRSLGTLDSEYDVSWD